MCQFSLSSEIISPFLKISCIRLHSQPDRKTANFLVKQPYCYVACRTLSPDVEGQTLTHKSQIATSPNCRLYRIHIYITFPLISLFLVFPKDYTYYCTSACLTFHLTSGFCLFALHCAIHLTLYYPKQLNLLK